MVASKRKNMMRLMILNFIQSIAKCVLQAIDFRMDTVNLLEEKPSVERDV